MNKINKKAESFGGWTEVILVSILLTSAFALVVAGFNEKYGKSYDSSFGTGLVEMGNSTLTNLTQYQKTFQDSVNTGTASFTSVFGLTLTTSYDILVSTLNLLWGLISGSWITKAVYLMRMPPILGTIFQLIYLIGIGYLLLRVLFRMKT